MSNHVRSVVLDVAAPLALFYGLRSATGDTTALVVSMTPPALNAVLTAVRQRRLDALAVAVLAGTALGAVAALLGGGPRELLARGAWFSAPAGLWTLATLFRRQPLTFEVTRTLLPHRATLMDRLWATDGRFRAAWRAITICWGGAALADSALRIVMAYTLPVAVVPALDSVLTIVTIVVLQLPTHLLLRRSGHWRSLFGRPAATTG
ncbi:VC0807 family protein [Amycolatopsis thermoflava]|uniref:VC0807 family protein n=1 Tax=Amycolatopsis thermoflava TaxID=84480 RepID=UPI000408C073|nr:VC0807 family protein [Amycolatopsis thermoflava]